MAPSNSSGSLLGSVLVTGGSGFVASHLIIQLLEAGYTVRTTIRSPSSEEHIRTVLNNTGLVVEGKLSFFVADLEKNEGWSKAVQGCDWVQHVASPFPTKQPENEDDLIRPAKEGTIRVLTAARDAGVKRVVLTSSFAAIGYGYERPPLFTEDNWSIIDGSVPVPAYHKSKTIAEKAAWDFIKRDGKGLELTVINPTGIFGPVLGSKFSASIDIVKGLMSGQMSGCPQISFGVVDVRDLAALHISAMTNSSAGGHRFIATSDNGPASLISIANIIRNNRPEMAQKVPSKQLPNFLVRIVALFRSDLRGMVPELGVVKKINNEKAKTMLNWKPRSIEECIIDTVDSLVKFGIV